MVEMGQHQPGMEVSTRAAHAHLIITAVAREQHPDGVAVYNFEVEDDHTYFVGWANGGIFVHNANCPHPIYHLEEQEGVELFELHKGSEEYQLLNNQ